MVISKKDFPGWQAAKQFVDENITVECQGMEEDSYVEAKILLDELRKEFGDNEEKIREIIIALDFIHKNF